MPFGLELSHTLYQTRVFHSSFQSSPLLCLTVKLTSPVWAFWLMVMDGVRGLPKFEVAADHGPKPLRFLALTVAFTERRHHSVMG